MSSLFGLSFWLLTMACPLGRCLVSSLSLRPLTFPFWTQISSWQYLRHGAHTSLPSMRPYALPRRCGPSLFWTFSLEFLESVSAPGSLDGSALFVPGSASCPYWRLISFCESLPYGISHSRLCHPDPRSSKATRAFVLPLSSRFRPDSIARQHCRICQTLATCG